MGIRDLMVETWSALAANKGRSALTILGIVIGIAAVIAMTSLIGGVKQSLVSELGLDQSRAVYISFWPATGESTTLASLQDIEENVKGYEFVTGSQYTGSKASTSKKETDASVMGVAPHFFRTLSATVLEGRLITDAEANSTDLVAVIDSTLAKSLYGEDESPVGQQISLGNDQYAIVGVIEAGNVFASQGSVYIPLGTCAQRLSGYEEIDQIVGFGREDADIQTVADETKDYLARRYGIDEENDMGYLYVETMQSIQQELDATMMSFQVLMTAVAGISLLVGGIGIMNMMLTNVTERIREIGLRKALGARRRDITMQFLVESVALCLAGGIIGFLLGLAAAYALSGAASVLTEGMQVRPYFDITTILMVVAICTVIGIVFGYGPARRAAKLDPVESLRYQ